MAAYTSGSSFASGECVGDMSSNVLENVKRTVKTLLLHKATLNTASEESRSLEDWVSERKKLQLELVELTTELQLRQSLADTPLEVGGSIGTEEQRLEDLEKELVSVKLQNLQDRKILECLHLQKYLKDQLFTKDHGDVEVSDTPVGKLTHQQTELVSELLYKQREVDRLRKEQWTVRQDRDTAQCECRKLMARLDELKEEKDDPVATECTDDDEDSPLNRLKQSLKNTEDEVALLRHMLLCLISGSGVNWSTDPDLCKLVVKLGLS